MSSNISRLAGLTAERLRELEVAPAIVPRRQEPQFIDETEKKPPLTPDEIAFEYYWKTAPQSQCQKKE